MFRKPPARHEESASRPDLGSQTANPTEPTQPANQPKFFHGIPESEQELISGSAEKRKVAAGEVVICSGDKASHLFLLTSGRAKYSRVTKHGMEIVLWWLAPGEVFGLATLLTSPFGYMGSVEAVEDCEILAWDHKTIRKLATTYPRLAENALRVTLIYLSIYFDRHAGLVAQTAEQRLAHVLVGLGHRTGRASQHGVEVDITNEHLSSLADVGPFTASRLLSGWERQGAIRKKRGKVLIQSPERLPVG